MLSPREQQSWWSRLKTPAALSLACLAATLLIAAQAFRGQPSSRSLGTSQTTSSKDAAYDTGKDTVSVLAGDGAKIDSLVENALRSEVHLSQEDVRKQVEVIKSQKSLATGSFKETKGESFAKIRHKQVEISHVNATREVINGMEILIVNDSSRSVPPKGVLFLFHGCSHSAVDWWYETPGCSSCLGLPEEVAITQAALRRNYVAVAFSSLDRDLHRCWDTTYPPEKSADIQTVSKVWQEILEREGWERIPHFALGGSSGGAFALFLAQRVPVDGICVVIMAVQPQTLETKPRTPDSTKSWNFPPTFFVAMERDDMTLEAVTSDIAVLKKQGVPVNEIIVKPRALTPSFFSDRIEEVDNVTSSMMFDALKLEGCINATGHLVDNPRSLTMSRRWQKALREGVPAAKTMNFNKDESAVFEELNLAWAGHELVSDPIEEILDWFSAKQDGPKLMTAINPKFL